jgi:hypothetical protein
VVSGAKGVSSSRRRIVGRSQRENQNDIKSITISSKTSSKAGINKGQNQVGLSSFSSKQD